MEDTSVDSPSSNQSKKSSIQKKKSSLASARQRSQTAFRWLSATSRNLEQEPDTEESTVIHDAKESFQQVRATKDGVKRTVHGVKTTASVSKKTVKKPYQLWHNRQKIFRESQQRLISTVRVIANFIANPLAIVQSVSIGGIIFVLVGLFLVLVVAVSSMVSTFSMKSDEQELTATWTYLTEKDADTTLSIQSGSGLLEVNGINATRSNVQLYTNLDQVLAYMDTTYGDFELDGLLSGTGGTTRSMIDSYATDLVNQTREGETDVVTLKTFEEVVERSEDTQEQLSAMEEIGEYAALEELGNPFADQEALVITERYGYNVEEGQKRLSEEVTFQHEEGEPLISPIAGTVTVSDSTIKISHEDTVLILENTVPTISSGTEISEGESLGQTLAENTLEVIYEKDGATVNPGFYFPDVSYRQSTNYGYSYSGGGFDESLFHFIIATRCNVFQDKADKIIAEARNAGVSPIIFAAIMIHESAWGTSTAIREYNNPSGQMSSSGLIRYATLDEGIEATGRTLHNLIVERELQTVEALGSVYCPVGAANDPLGLNANWVPAIKGFMETLGGAADMSLLWAASSGRAGLMLDYANSLVGQGVIYTQDARRGTFPYFDCSAFVTTAMRAAGLDVQIGNTNYLYTLEGSLLQPISRSEVQPGDIFVWGNKGNSGGNLGHTGIFIDEGNTIIHCTTAAFQNGSVVITPFDGWSGNTSLAPVYFYRIV